MKAEKFVLLLILPFYAVSGNAQSVSDTASMKKEQLVATIGGHYTNGLINKDVLIAGALIPVMKYARNEQYWQITSFRISIADSSRNRKINFDGNNYKLTQEMKDEITKCASGTRITFDSIKAKGGKGTDGGERLMDPLDFSLK